MTRRFEHTDLFRPAARAILFDGESVLLLNHRKGIKIFPGGGLEENEKVEDANLLPVLRTTVLDREVMEEIRLDISGRKRILICSVEWWNDPKRRMMSRLDFIFGVRVDHETLLSAKAIGEIKSLENVKIAGSFSLPSHLAPNTKAAIISFRRLLARLREPSPEFISVA